MKMKKWTTTVLAGLAISAGAVGLCASASMRTAYDYNFTLSNGGSGYTSFYPTDGSSYGSVVPRDSGLSSSNFYNVAFCNEDQQRVTDVTGMMHTNSPYHLDYYDPLNSACLHVMNTAVSRRVTGLYDPAGSL